MELEEITKLIHEYRELAKMSHHLSENQRSRLSRLDHIFGGITLTGVQIMEMQDFDPLLLGNNDIRRSSLYEELKEENEELRERYERLEGRYKTLAGKVEGTFNSPLTLKEFFELRDLLEKQGVEASRETYRRI